MKAFLTKHHEMVLYGICGVPTVAVNFLVYFVMASFEIRTVICAFAAMIASIVVAYFTNKIWVFHMKRNRKRDAFKEFVEFVFCRMLSGLLEVSIMVSCVDMLRLDEYETCIKLVATVVVIILNYVASKMFIFKDN